MAERQLPKLNVAGSIPVSRSNKSATYYDLKIPTIPLCLPAENECRTDFEVFQDFDAAVVSKK